MGNELLESTTHGGRSGSDPAKPAHASQPHATTIRAGIRHKDGKTYLAQAVTILTANGLAAYFQLYQIHANGRTTLETESAYSTEASAVDRWSKHWLGQ